MCVYRFEFAEVSITEALIRKLADIDQRRDHLAQIMGSEGSLSMNIGLSGALNVNLVLEPEVCSLIGRLGLKLSIECFPDG
jgi:hypothetical protein